MDSASEPSTPYTVPNTDKEPEKNLMRLNLGQKQISQSQKYKFILWGDLKLNDSLAKNRALKYATQFSFFALLRLDL